jgi:hypothetical protein
MDERLATLDGHGILPTAKRNSKQHRLAAGHPGSDVDV